jgi:tetratricopeptide (TPR) repeat protein
MLRATSLALLILLLMSSVSCKNQSSDDGGLELSDEQLKELMKKQPTMPGQSSGEEIMIQMELAYQQDSSDLNNVYNLAFTYCGKCLESQDAANCNKAIQYLSRTIKLKPDYRKGKAYFNRQLCYQVLGKHAEALADLNSFIPIHAKADTIEVNYFLAKANVLYQLERRDEACATLKEAYSLDTLGLSQIEWKEECN